MTASFVIPPDELSALNFLEADHARPVQADWINRGTDQILKRQSVDMLLRTLFVDVLSPSAVTLHRSAGLRLQFETEAQRLKFAKEFAVAKVQEHETREHYLTMMFDERSGAALAAEQLVQQGVPKSAISLLWRAGQFMDADHAWIKGHSLLSVAGATAGGSLAGVALGIALLAIPGVGQIAVIGGFASATVTATSVISGMVGATAAAITKMFSDADVDDVALKQYVNRSGLGRIFMAIDLRKCPDEDREVLRLVLKRNGGRALSRS